MFNDYWMIDQGFLKRETFGDLRDVIARRHSEGATIFVGPHDTLNTAYSRMKVYDISQLPVVDSEETLAGLVTEIDLLNHLLTSDHPHDPNETIEPVMQSKVATINPDTPLEAVMSIFVTGQVAVITENKKPVGILTKIDLLDYLSSQKR